MTDLPHIARAVARRTIAQQTKMAAAGRACYIAQGDIFNQLDRVMAVRATDVHGIGPPEGFSIRMIMVTRRH
jgi:hypothetical protein